MTINFGYEACLSKQELLYYVSETYGNNKSANRLKRIIFKNYSGKYIFYGDKKFEGNSKGIEDLYKFISK